MPHRPARSRLLSLSLLLFRRCAALALLALLPGLAAALQLDAAASELRLAGDAGAALLGRLQPYRQLAGTLDADGRLSLVVDYGGVTRAPQLQDERLRGLLAEVAQLAVARLDGRIAARLDRGPAAGLAPGQGLELALTGTLLLQGRAEPVALRLWLERLADGGWSLDTLAPLAVTARSADLPPGLDRARQSAGVAAGARSLPVVFRAVFR